MKETNYIKEKIINTVKDRFEVKPYDLKDLEQFNYPRHIHIFKFNAYQYKVIGLGNISILEGKSIIGMYLITVVFTPAVNMDIPLLIIDFVAMRNNITVFVEFFTEHINDKNNIKLLEQKLSNKGIKYKNIENYQERYNWYVPLRNSYSPLKKSSKNNKSVLEDMIIDYLEEYLIYTSKINKDNDIKYNLSLQRFIDDLIVKGNPSTSILEKALGRDGYEKFSRQVIFYYT